jgi:hypothetical protein
MISDLADGPGPSSGYPLELRQQLVDALCSGQPFSRVLHNLGLTSNQVWGLTRTDPEWSNKLEAALTATRRDDLEHGTTPAYVRGCVCSEYANTSGSGCPGIANR